MVRHDRRRGRQRDREAGVQHVAGDDREELRDVDVAAGSQPEHDTGRRRQRRNPPAGEQHESLDADPHERGHRALQFDLQRARVAVSPDQADDDEWKKERRGKLARAERRRPDSDQR
jgi:hypothetical protein